MKAYKKLSNQEVFDVVWDWFITKGHPQSLSRRADGLSVCSYRGADGTKCAAGVILPDDLYDYRYEGQNSSHVYVFQELVQDTYFLRELQIIHDTFFDTIEDSLRRLALKHKLVVPK